MENRGAALIAVTMSADNPYATPEADLAEPSVTGDEIYSDGRYVVAREVTAWPNRCYECNEPASRHAETKASYVNPWWYLTILINIVIAIIIVMIVRKNYRLLLPMCEKHHLRARRIGQAKVLVAVAFMGFLVAAIVIQNLITVLITVMLFLGLMMLAVVSRTVYVAKRKEDWLYYSGAGKPFVRALPAFLR